jgi:hypothetical protein
MLENLCMRIENLEQDSTYDDLDSRCYKQRSTGEIASRGGLEDPALAR